MAFCVHKLKLQNFFLQYKNMKLSVICQEKQATMGYQHQRKNIHIVHVYWSDLYVEGTEVDKTILPI